MKHRVTCSPESAKELILKNHKKYYGHTETLKREILKIYIYPDDIQEMYEYMEKTK